MIANNPEFYRDNSYSFPADQINFPFYWTTKKICCSQHQCGLKLWIMSNQKWKSLTPREKRQWEGNATTRRALYLNLELWFCQKSSLILRLSLRKRHTVCWKLRSERWKSIDVRGDGRNIGKHLRKRNSDIKRPRAFSSGRFLVLQFFSQ